MHVTAYHHGTHYEAIPAGGYALLLVDGRHVGSFSGWEDLHDLEAPLAIWADLKRAL